MNHANNKVNMRAESTMDHHQNVAAIFHAVYSSIWNPSVHLQVQNLEYHILLVSTTQAACGTDSLHLVCHQNAPWNDDMNYFTGRTTISMPMYCKLRTQP